MKPVKNKRIQVYPNQLDSGALRRYTNVNDNKNMNNQHLGGAPFVPELF